MIFITIYILSLIIIVFLHELIHWIFAVKFKRNPTLHFEHFIIPVVSYRNNGNNIQNMIISASAPLTLTLLGLIIDSDDPYLFFAKALLTFNVINLLPITADGQVILISIIKIIKKEKI